jgi:hypothetical protein
MISIKVYDNMNNKKLKMLILNMVLNFTFVCNPEKLQVRQFKQSTYPCFHPEVEIDKEPLQEKSKKNPSL